MAKNKILLAEIIAARGGSCRWCGRAVSQALPPEHPARATLEHIIPKSQGGTNDRDNLTVACMACNCAKGDKSVAAFASQRMAAKKRVQFRQRGKKKRIVLADTEHRSAWKRQVQQAAD